MVMEFFNDVTWNFTNSEVLSPEPKIGTGGCLLHSEWQAWWPLCALHVATMKLCVVVRKGPQHAGFLQVFIKAGISVLAELDLQSFVYEVPQPSTMSAACTGLVYDNICCLRLWKLEISVVKIQLDMSRWDHISHDGDRASFYCMLSLSPTSYPGYLCTSDGGGDCGQKCSLVLNCPQAA